MSPLQVVLVVGVVTLAACLQGSIGFGMALVAAPILVLVDPTLVPGPLIASALVLVTLVAIRDRAHADLRTVRFSMLGQAVGAYAGASVLARLDPRGFGILFGALVLLAVAISALGFHLRVTKTSALSAGLLGGFMGATSSIGGPPMALVYQHEGSARFRGTLSAYFIVSCVVSLTALAWVGRFGWHEVQQAMVLVPGQVAGFLLSYPMTRLLRETSVRPFVLGLSALAATGVLARAFL